MSEYPNILITNDDGIAAEGLRALEGSLKNLGTIAIVAPELEQSASSHAITLDKPLRMREFGKNRYAVSGTPTDCVLAAVHGILKLKPDLIVSGINHGPNMGEDVHYSGTVAAALEGCILGITSMAVSIASWSPSNFEGAAFASRILAKRILELRAKGPSLWNVNVPELPADKIRGIRITKLGSRIYKDLIVRKKDPRGKEYFWIGGGEPGWNEGEDTDFSAVNAGFVSVTPLRIDLTDYDSMQNLKELEQAWKHPKNTA